VVLAHRTGFQVSVATMSRLRQRLGARRGQPKPTVGCPWDKPRRDRKLRRIRRLVRDVGRNERVVSLDEVDIDLNPKIGLDGMLPGQEKPVLTPGQNEKRSLAGALDARSGRLTWVEGPRKTSLLLLQRLNRVVRRTYRSARRIHVILEKTHPSEESQGWGQHSLYRFPGMRRRSLSEE
jgi:hypothetical protein